MPNNQKRSDVYNKLIKEWVTFFKTQTVILYALLKKKGVTEQEIADALGISKQAVNMNLRILAEKEGLV